METTGREVLACSLDRAVKPSGLSMSSWYGGRGSLRGHEESPPSCRGGESPPFAFGEPHCAGGVVLESRAQEHHKRAIARRWQERKRRSPPVVDYSQLCLLPLAQHLANLLPQLSRPPSPSPRPARALPALPPTHLAMVKIRTNRTKPPPEGFEDIESILDEYNRKMRDGSSFPPSSPAQH